MLPIGPTGMGDSPYNALSAFAGNPFLISLDDMVADGHLSKAQLPKPSPTERVNYEQAKIQKNECLRKAYENFSSKRAFADFCSSGKSWLEPFARFIALKEHNKQCAWMDWKGKSPSGASFENEVRFHTFVQFVFFEQWKRLRSHCVKRGVKLIGDIPIYVAQDSADVWAHPELFYLRRDGRASFVAGTPPDYFSKTGQWWGNPLYRWPAHKKTRYRWWSARLHHMLGLFDMVRLDHFIGFERFWKIDARDRSAKNGTWSKGPGEHFFKTVLKKKEYAKFIAEDLGATGPDIEKLRRRFGFPGMKVLHFSFDKGFPSFERNSAVYTGTHDNDTTRGWFEKLSADEQQKILSLIGATRKDVHWGLIGTGLAAKSVLAVFPVQDVLGLGSEARMNTPGQQWGNWNWRLKRGEFARAELPKLKKLTATYDRI